MNLYKPVGNKTVPDIPNNSAYVSNFFLMRIVPLSDLNYVKLVFVLYSSGLGVHDIVGEMEAINKHCYCFISQLQSCFRFPEKKRDEERGSKFIKLIDEHNQVLI